MDREDALKAMRRGAIAAVVSATVTAGAMVLARAGSGDGLLGYFADPWMILDVGLMLALAWGVHRRSRTAAVLLLLTFVAARIILALDTGRFPFPLLSLLLIWFFARAIQGAVVWHRLQRQADAGHRPGWAWPVLLGAPVAVLVGLGLTFSVMSWNGSLLPGRVQDGTELAAPVRDQLRALGLVESDERVAWFYAHGLRSVGAGGNLLTDRRVVAWWPGQDGELEHYAIALADLRYVELEQPGGVLEPAVYRIGSENPEDWLTLVLATEKGGDRRFIEAIRKRVASNLHRAKGG